MIQITEIEIRYFRSIYILRFPSLNEINTFVGENDVGKSNILKAVNLFFNEQTEYNTKINFQQDFNSKRLQEVRKETIKGKQFIQISIVFERGKDRFVKSLPEKFKIIKTWFRESDRPKVRINAVKGKRDGNYEAYINKYLSSIKYEYIPAIKDNAYYQYLISKFQEVVINEQRDNRELGDSLISLNKSISSTGKSLNDEFLSVSKIYTSIELPENLNDLLSAFQISTNAGEEKRNLEYRGSGIQSRFIPSILFYLSEHSNKHYIWGFEEPENCLEYKLSSNLMYDILNKYSIDIQILLTTHSPAFFSSDNTKLNVFRIYKEKSDIKQFCCKNHFSWQKNTIEIISDDIGIMEIQRNAQLKIDGAMKQVSLLNNSLSSLQNKLKEIEKPIVLTEGKWDEVIVTEAWNKIYECECPYRITSCEENNEEKSISGADFLQKCMETIRRDYQKCIGIFDHDSKGVKCFNKISNYHNSMYPAIKVHTNQHAAVVTLPEIEERKDYYCRETMVIEFMFPEDVINKKLEGKGLELDFMEIEKRLTSDGSSIGREKSTELYYRQIRKSSKKHFAEKIVPNLSKKDFLNFTILFDILEKGFKILQ